MRRVWDGGYRHDDYAIPPPRGVECRTCCGKGWLLIGADADDGQPYLKLIDCPVCGPENVETPPDGWCVVHLMFDCDCTPENVEEPK